MLTDDVAQWVASRVTGLSYSDTDVTGNVFVDRLPTTPDQAVAFYTQPGLEADSKLPYDPAEFQVIVRGNPDGRWARAMWASIYSRLHGLGLTQMGETLVVYVLATQSSPTPLGDDGDGRPSFSGSFRTEVYNPTDRRP